MVDLTVGKNRFGQPDVISGWVVELLARGMNVYYPWEDRDYKDLSPVGQTIVDLCMAGF